MTGSPNIRFYAGEVITYKGCKLGTVCIIDRKPRRLIDQHKTMLKMFGRIVESELKKYHYLNKLTFSNERMKKISNVIGHDMKNLVQSISSLSDVICNDISECDYTMIRHMDSSAKDALRLSNDLLDSCNIESNSLSINREEVTIDEFMDKYFVVPGVTDVDVQYQGVVSMDGSRINQVLTNLITNSQENMDEDDGVIKIKCEKDKSFLNFTVQDNGPGIPMDKRKLLFKESHENIVTVTESNQKSHLGLGLSNSKGIIELHGGQVWLDEEYIKGTKICFTIPLSE